MKKALVNPEKCVGCTICDIEVVCEKQAIIRESPEDKPWIDFYKCAGCLKCKLACPFGAIDDITQPCTGQAKKGW